MIEVVSIGQIIMDVLVRPVEDIDFQIDTRQVDKIILETGGDSFNVAVGLSKLKAKVAFNGKIGTDTFGTLLLQAIQKNGIYDSGVVVCDKMASSSSVALIKKNGDRCFLFYPGTNDHLGIDDIGWSLIDEARIVHLGGIYTLPLLDGENIRKILAYAKGRKKITTLDVSWDKENRWLREIEASLPYIDYFLPSHVEAKEITKLDDPGEIAVFFQNAGVRNVIIKLGKEGSYIKPEGKDGFYVKSIESGDVIDTTGAGDAYVAGFIKGLLNGWEIKDCALFGTVVAGQSIQKIGATAGVPKYEEALRIFKDRTGSNKY